MDTLGAAHPGWEFLEAVVHALDPDAPLSHPTPDELMVRAGTLIQRASGQALSTKQLRRYLAGESLPPTTKLATWLKASPPALTQGALEARKVLAAGRGAPPRRLDAPRVASYLSGLLERAATEATERVQVDVTGTIADDAVDLGLDVHPTSAPLTESLSLILHGQAPARLHVRGARGMARSYFCRQIAYALAAKFDPDRSVRVPILVDWATWLDRLRQARVRPVPESLAAECLLSAADTLFTAHGSALAFLAREDVVPILTGVDEASTRSEAWRSTLGVLKRMTRLVFADVADDPKLPSELVGAIRRTHVVRLLLPRGSLTIGRACRQLMLEQQPGLPHLGTMGDVPSLQRPEILGRVLCLISNGRLTPATLTSEAAIHAAVYLAARCEERSRPAPEPLPERSRGLLSPFVVLPDVEGLPAREREALAGFIASEADPVMLKSHSTRLLRRSGEWVGENLEAGRRFALAWVAPEVPADLLGHVDPEGMRLLVLRSAELTGDTSNFDRTRAMWDRTNWSRQIAETLDALEAPAPGGNLWASVQASWAKFVSALGVLRGLAEVAEALGDSASLRDLQATAGRAREAFSPLWRTDGHRPGLGNLRYHGARAMAAILNVQDLLAALTSSKASIAQELGFWADIAAHVTDRLYRRAHKARFLPCAPWKLLSLGDASTGAEEVADQLLTVLQGSALQVGQKGDEHLRHMRYHAVAAIARLAPPRAARRILGDLVGGFPVKADGEAVRNRAVEAATAVGALYRHGAQVSHQPAMLAESLVDGIEAEIKDVGSGPLFVTLHKFLALESVAPLLSPLRRKELLERIPLRALAVGELVNETAALKSLLYWVRQEAADGIRLPDPLLAHLGEVFTELKAQLPATNSGTAGSRRLNQRPDLSSSSPEHDVLLEIQELLDVTRP